VSARAQWITLVAMTLANSMILIDQTGVPLAIPEAVGDLGSSLDTSQWILTANVLPLAGLMVLGGRLGDQLGLRRVFLAGAVCFVASSALAGAAQNMPWLLTMRVTQGIGAALMMPTTMAIVTATFPPERRGRALGLMAGASAFFAALGPVLGGLLTEFIDWRAVLLVNVPLAAITIALTLWAAPAGPPRAGVARFDDWWGVVTFAVAIGGITLGFGQVQDWGWSAPTLVALGVGFGSLVAFVEVERRHPRPLMSFGLFRRLNYAMASISQFIAGSIELACAYLLPFFMLLVIGFAPGTAGLALVPATLPIILVAPLAGRWFDRSGGRAPLTVGFVVLAASCFALGLAFESESYTALIPGLVLQGIGLGIVLTVNDPTGLSSVPPGDQGQAAGVIDTSEQLGGAIGIAVFTVVLLHTYFDDIFEQAANFGVRISDEQMRAGHEFALRAEQEGFRRAEVPSELPARFAEVFKSGHADAFRFTFVLMGAIALVGAALSFLLVRREDRARRWRVFSRRSRWTWALTGEGPGLTRKPEGVTAAAAGNDAGDGRSHAA
jgi:EmrB/QacA subfamily drug resistance transporter